MIIQFILVGILLIAVFFGVLRKSKAPLVALMMVVLSGMGIILVIFPSIAQNLANLVGVSRGVDLITYTFMAVMMVVLFDIYLRLQAALEMLTSVVRHISLVEAPLNDKTKDNQLG